MYWRQKLCIPCLPVTHTHAPHKTIIEKITYGYIQASNTRALYIWHKYPYIIPHGLQDDLSRTIFLQITGLIQDKILQNDHISSNANVLQKNYKKPYIFKTKFSEGLF